MFDTIWVTGAAGYTGRFVAAALKKHFSPVAIVGIDIANPAEGFDDWLTLDLRNSGMVKEAVEHRRPDAVLHLAGALLPADDNTLYGTNVGCTMGLLAGLKLAGAESTRIVTIGSAAEYSAGATDPIAEDHPTIPASAYGNAKLAQTLLALQLGSEWGMNVIVARTFNLIGPGMTTNLVAGAFSSQVADETTAELVVGNTNSIRDFIYIDDAVDAYCSLLIKGKANSIYNVCTGQGRSIRDFISTLIATSGRDLPVRVDEGRVRTNEHDISIGDARKIQKATGWRPAIGFEKAVRLTLESFRRR